MLPKEDLTNLPALGEKHQYTSIRLSIIAAMGVPNSYKKSACNIC